jgi:hypothetical protein
MILLPHHHEFRETLANLPHFYQRTASQTCELVHLIQKNPSYIPEMVDNNRLKEYLLGGEVNEFVEYVDGYSDCVDDDLLDCWELGDEWLGSI